jgi:ABC-type nickel/cobalt efflux system permease component RcnA
MKNAIHTLLVAGILTPWALSFIVMMFGLSGGSAISLQWLFQWLIVMAHLCVLGLIIWMIRYRTDEGRRAFGIVIIILFVISMFASSPTVIK